MIREIVEIFNGYCIRIMIGHIYMAISKITKKSVRALDLSSHFYSNTMIYPKGLLGNLS